MNSLKNENIHLKRVNFVVTKKCNLNCRMCDVPEQNALENDSTLDEIRGLIKEAAELGADTLELSGGEPMTRSDIYEIISFAVSLKLNVFMATNGVLIGPDQTQKLLEAGLTRIAFSLEGPEEFNDYIRGKGNYKKTFEAIQSFCAYNEKIPELQVMVGITLSRFNYKEILPFSEYLLSNTGIHSISINPFNSTMMTRENLMLRGHEFQVPAGLISDLAIEMEKLAGFSETVPGKLPPARYIRKIPAYFEGRKLVPEGGCSIPFTFIGVSPDGWIYPCWHGPCIGHYKNKTLHEILDSDTSSQVLEMAAKGMCRGCLSSCYFEIY